MIQQINKDVIDVQGSQRENTVIALHLNVSAEEPSLEEKGIFAHERFIQAASLVLGFCFPTRV